LVRILNEDGYAINKAIKGALTIISIFVK